MITNNNTTTNGNTKAGMGLLLSWLDCSPGAESPVETTGKITTEVLSGVVGSSVGRTESVFCVGKVSDTVSWVASTVKVTVAAIGVIKTAVDVGLFLGVPVLAGCVAEMYSVLVGVGDGPMVGTVWKLCPPQTTFLGINKKSVIMIGSNRYRMLNFIFMVLSLILWIS